MKGEQFMGWIIEPLSTPGNDTGGGCSSFCFAKGCGKRDCGFYKVCFINS